MTRRKLLRLLAVPLLLFSIALLVVACDEAGSAGPGDDGGGVIITPLDTPEDAAPTAVVEPTTEASNGGAAPSPTQPVGPSGPISGFIYPLDRGCLPTGDQLMPNAPRDYRAGIHEGVDFYNSDNCTAIGLGTPVRAAKAGVVIRADLDYADLTAERYAELTQNLTSAESLDTFRGRQVWIDHGDGIVTRYCHLSAIADNVAQGTPVNAGAIVAYVGESGTPESINNPGNQYHLHFELRVGDSYLGAGLSPSEVRSLYLALFSE